MRKRGGETERERDRLRLSEGVRGEGEREGGERREEKSMLCPPGT